MEDRPHQRLGVFQSDSGVTLSFGEKTYFVSLEDPFYNIALKSVKQNDYVPFYVEIAKREGLGPEFRDALLKEINKQGKSKLYYENVAKRIYDDTIKAMVDMTAQKSEVTRRIYSPRGKTNSNYT